MPAFSTLILCATDTFRSIPKQSIEVRYSAQTVCETLWNCHYYGIGVFQGILEVGVFQMKKQCALVFGFQPTGDQNLKNELLTHQQPKRN